MAYLPGWSVPIPGGTGRAPEIYPATTPGQNSMNPPTPQERAVNTAYLTMWGRAVAKAEAAPIQAAVVAQGGRPGSISPGALTVQDDGRGYGGGSFDGPGFTQAQLQEIADAPQIGHKDEYKTPACTTVDDNAHTCPPMVSNTPWGNSGVSFPGPKPCSTGIVGWVSQNPWLFIGLVVAGGFALDSLMDDTN